MEIQKYEAAKRYQDEIHKYKNIKIIAKTPSLCEIISSIKESDTNLYSEVEKAMLRTIEMYCNDKIEYFKRKFKEL